ncbi:MAG: GIY-YIG nuclease family protein [Pseudomonadota bacterium]
MTAAAASPWSVYILEMANGAWYTGIATDVDARYAAHASGRGARAVRMGGGPRRLLWTRQVGGHGDALRLERAIKQLSRARKGALIRGELDWSAVLMETV